jgi:hypothetical protein
MSRWSSRIVPKLRPTLGNMTPLHRTFLSRVSPPSFRSCYVFFFVFSTFFTEGTTGPAGSSTLRGIQKVTIMEPIFLQRTPPRLQAGCTGVLPSQRSRKQSTSGSWTPTSSFNGCSSGSWRTSYPA